MNEPTKTEKIAVFAPGTHAGKRYTPGPEGVELEVSPGEAKFLRDSGATKRPALATSSPGLAEVPSPRSPIATRPQG